MKKSFLVLSIFLIFSCSKNVENIAPSTIDPSNILLKRTVTHNYGAVYETVFTYDGKKLLQQKSIRQRKEFVYDVDKIIKISWFQNPDSQNTLLQYVDFEYFPDGKLKRFKKYLDAPETVDFIYNSNGTVDFAYVADYNSTYNFNGRLKIENNEVTQYDYISGNNTPTTKFFNYDDKNHPLKNVVGYDKLVLYNYFYASMHYSGFSTNVGNNHNQTSYRESSNPSQIITTYSIEYNNNNFPININKNDDFAADFLFYE